MANDFVKVGHDRQLGSEELKHEVRKKNGEPGYLESEYKSPSSSHGSPLAPYISPTNNNMRTAFDDNPEWTRSIQTVCDTVTSLSLVKINI